jgi:hypothetical protein
VEVQTDVKFNMKSPYTGREMRLVSTLNSKDRFYLCPDTNTLIYTNHITKFDMEESKVLIKKLLNNIKA